MPAKTGKLIATDEEKAEVLRNFFASVLTGSPSARRQDGDWGSDVLLLQKIRCVIT